MSDTPTLDDFPSTPEPPEEYDDEYMTALHDLDVDGVDVVDGSEHDGPHGTNTVEEMEAHELTPVEMSEDGLDLFARADGAVEEGR